MNILSAPAAQRPSIAAMLQGKEKAPAELKEQVDALVTLGAGLDDDDALKDRQSIRGANLTATQAYERLTAEPAQPVVFYSGGEWRPITDIESLLSTYRQALENPELHLATSHSAGVPIHIRMASHAKDWTTFEALGNLAFPERPRVGEELEQHFYAARGSKPVIAETGDGRGLGFYVVSTDNRLERGGHVLEFLGVAPQARGAKVGEQLLQDALARVKEAGAPSCALEVEADNVPAIRLYEKAGFVTVEPLPDYYGPGRHGQLMQANLAP
jgi:ribosomal protein S18 acetylase RimI-like enzyme